VSALSLPATRRLAAVAPVIVRVIVGLIMAAHGWQKLQGGPSNMSGFLGGLGVPAPGLFAWILTLGELLGGLALVVGLLSRLAALGLIIDLVLAILLVKVNTGLIAPQGGGAGAELDLALIAGFVAVLLLGPGRPSLDHALGIEQTVPVSAETATAARRR
jgi:putative oxidoreductase